MKKAVHVSVWIEKTEGKNDLVVISRISKNIYLKQKKKSIGRACCDNTVNK